MNLAIALGNYQKDTVILHIALHFVLPLLVAAIFARNQIIKIYLLMMATMVVDIDHLLADPIYDPDRCSIGFHPLHSYVAIGIYAGALWFRSLRMIATGLLIHMFLDGTDCLRMAFWS